MLYRQIALREGMSFSQYVNTLLEHYTHRIIVTGKGDGKQIDIKRKREEEPVWSLRPFHFNKAVWTKEHDRIIYESPHGTGKK